MFDKRHRTAIAAVAALALLSTAVACTGDTGPERSGGSGDAAPTAAGDPVARTAGGAGPGDLYVVRGPSATLSPGADGGTELSLTVDGEILAFTDRPARGAERITAAELVAGWASFGFEADPPNAALTGTGAGSGDDGADVDVAVEVTDPRWDPASSTLRVTVRPIGADLGVPLPDRLTSVGLFIDDADNSAELVLYVNGGGAFTVAGIESTPVDTPFTPLGTEVQGNDDAWMGPDGAWLEVGQVLTQAGSFGAAPLVVENPAPGQQVTLTLTLATQLEPGSTPPPPPGVPDLPPPPATTVEYEIAFTFSPDGSYQGTVTVPPDQPPGSGLDTQEMGPAGPPNTYVIASSEWNNNATLFFE